MHLHKFDDPPIRISYKYLDLIYFLPQSLIQKLIEKPASGNVQAKSIFKSADLTELIDQLVSNVYKNGDQESKYKATLNWVYNLSLQGKYQQAKEVFLKTISYEKILN